MVEKPVYYEGREIHPQLVDMYLQRLGNPDRVLDLGCGTGDFGRHAPEGTTVVGTDIDSHALRAARGHERVVGADAARGRLPFANEAFEAVLAKDILEHLREPGFVVAEIFRILSPGGTLLVSVPMAKPSVVWNDYTHIRGFTEGAVRTMLQDAGFRVQCVAPMGGIRGFGRFGLVHLLPTVLRLPLVRRFAVSHEVVCVKHFEDG